MKIKVTEMIGWYGVLALLTAYGMITFGIISSKSLSFQLLNFTGALGIIIDAYYDKNYQPVVLNIVWAIIALIAIINIFLSI